MERPIRITLFYIDNILLVIHRTVCSKQLRLPKKCSLFVRNSSLSTKTYPSALTRNLENLTVWRFRFYVLRDGASVLWNYEEIWSPSLSFASSTVRWRLDPLISAMINVKNNFKKFTLRYMLKYRASLIMFEAHFKNRELYFIWLRVRD